MKDKIFVLSDEQVNSYGFKVLTSGISLERFKKNPVMLFEHDRNKVIGKWKNVVIKDNQLTASPVFDQEDEHALSISKKVDKGFINGASIGINILEMDTTGKVPIAVKTEVFETSIVSIPSNSNALHIVDENGVKLSNDEVYTKLSLPHTINLTQRIGDILGLTNATDLQLINEIKELKQKPVNEFIQKSLSEGRFLGGEKDYFKNLLLNDFDKAKN